MQKIYVQRIENLVDIEDKIFEIHGISAALNAALVQEVTVQDLKGIAVELHEKITDLSKMEIRVSTREMSFNKDN
ncbi:MAG TPA: hypothetical protein DCZ10_15750 [Pelotomaculum sp.]|nr:hypothetical protein [Pelotomaculum sp.]